jgi:DNA-binding MarR family transcriptional regulator
MALMNDESHNLSAPLEHADPHLPPSDSHADRLLRLIHWTSAASRQLRRRLAAIANAFDLSDTELLVVWLCSGSGRVQVDLAGAIGVSPAQMSGMVERLRARGLVAMQRQAMDRRRQVWRTSAAGQTLLSHAAAHLKELAVSLSGSLSGDEQHTVQTLCERLAEAVATVSAPPPSKTRSAIHHDEQRVSKEAA